MMETLLKIRKEIKERKPDFIRQDTHKRNKLEVKWRKPKGIHSKIRHRFKGRGRMPSPGYKSPKEVKDYHASGLKIVNIFSIKDLGKIKREDEGIIIARNIGMRKRLEILKKSKEMNINILNLNSDEQIKKIQDFMDLKKKDVTKGKKESAKEPKEKKESKDKENISDEQKKELDKKEKDKILTKRV